MTTKSKIKLGSTPKNFTKQVEIPMLDGSVEHLDIRFIYRTRSQFAQLVDDNMATARAANKKLQDEQAAVDGAAAVADVAADDKTVAALFREVDQYGAAYVLKIADDWDLDSPFTEASLIQLEDEHPGALNAIGTAYRQAVAEARTKN